MLKRLATRDSNTCKQLDATNMDAKATESANEERRIRDGRDDRGAEQMRFNAMLV